MARLELRGDDFVPAFGKVRELGELDDFVWATLHGWGALPAHKLLVALRKGAPFDIADPATEAKTLDAELREEEGDLRLLKFTDEEASRDYPYLISLASVRLWAMVEAAVREVLVECMKHSTDLPGVNEIAKLSGPVLPFVGASSEEQAAVLADMVWRSASPPLPGVQRFDWLLERIGLAGETHTVIVEITRELSEVRHCVVHRGGQADQKLLRLCPWLQISVGEKLPSTLQRFWYYRTAAYAYILGLARRWAVWRQYPAVVAIADHMNAAVLEDMVPSWNAAKVVHSEAAGSPHAGA